MSVLDVFKFRKRVSAEHIRASRKKLDRALNDNAKASDEFHEAIDDLLRRMDSSRRARRNVENH